MSWTAAARGYSFVELLVVLAIVATLAAQAVPAIKSVVSTLRLKLAVDAMVNCLSLTRSEAIKRNARVVMCKSRSGKVCEAAVGWEAGWLVFQDSNNNSQVDPGEAIIYQHGELSRMLAFFTNAPVANYVSYTALGTTRYPSGALQMGTFTVCEKSLGATVARDIVIGNVGRPRVALRNLRKCPDV